MRPYHLFEDFIVEEKVQGVSEAGRIQSSFKYQANGEVISGILAKAGAAEVEKWRQNQHIITHIIVQKYGKVGAKEGDRLVNGSRIFYVQGVDDCSMSGYFILYRVEERNDRA